MDSKKPGVGPSSSSTGTNTPSALDQIPSSQNLVLPQTNEAAKSNAGTEKMEKANYMLQNAIMKSPENKSGIGDKFSGTKSQIEAVAAKTDVPGYQASNQILDSPENIYLELANHDSKVGYHSVKNGDKFTEDGQCSLTTSPTSEIQILENPCVHGLQATATYFHNTLIEEKVYPKETLESSLVSDMNIKAANEGQLFMNTEDKEINQSLNTVSAEHSLSEAPDNLCPSTPEKTDYPRNQSEGNKETSNLTPSNPVTDALDTKGSEKCIVTEEKAPPDTSQEKFPIDSSKTKTAADEIPEGDQTFLDDKTFEPYDGEEEFIFNNRMQSPVSFSCPLPSAWNEQSEDDFDFQQCTPSFAEAKGRLGLEEVSSSEEADSSPEMEVKQCRKVRRPLGNLFAEDSASEFDDKSSNGHEQGREACAQAQLTADSSPAGINKQKPKMKSYFKLCICLPAVQ
eukprot:TRINITY_DN5725_c0_g1_i2.p1 TRINITY_DN5725_c0_g1~~TRINITY_DN5725_c0_g1_i2.p1  ORF type:complete len:455 (+),score=113.54 TRINITY_DN5725_c0_g1_i2:873-2237(+)